MRLTVTIEAHVPDPLPDQPPASDTFPLPPFQGEASMPPQGVAQAFAPVTGPLDNRPVLKALLAALLAALGGLLQPNPAR